jgi:PKD repeat protein
MYWSSNYSARYVPSYCYGHDEPTMSYLSAVNGSGANASFELVLPADSSSYAQGDFYATIWFGGTVYDTASTGGGSQAFLELQLYPAAPFYTGTGSGTKDCLPNGAYVPSFSPGTNRWFACAIVWQLRNTAGGLVEDAAYARPVDLGSSSAILVMKSNDHLFVNYSGVAQSGTVPWNISIDDSSSGTAGWALLKNGSLVLSPYYATATSSNTLKWGASNPGAIAFAYEIGHAYNVAGSCTPGDGACDSYWPGRWAASGQLQLSLPVMGSPGSRSYPSQIALSSSQGGEYAVNASSCGGPSFSTSTNCMYPFYLYRAGSYSFDFSTSVVANSTHDYRNKYQFPASVNGQGQWNANVQPAPWGTVRFVVYPANASASFNRNGSFAPLNLGPNRSAVGQFLEGSYWLNVSAAGCAGSFAPHYVSPGGSYSFTVALACGGSSLVAHAVAAPTSGTFPLAVTFNGSASGGTAPYGYSWSFGDGATSSVASPSHTYTAPGTLVATLLVSDANGTGSLASVNISVSTPSCAGANRTVPLGQYQYCHLAKGQHAVFLFNVTKADWFSNAWVDVYALDGKVTGVQPVFKIGTGMGGTPSLAAAKQKKGGPNAHLQIFLNRQAANKYHGWGLYWVYVVASGGSGGFCFIAAYSNGSLGNGPTCSKAVASPRSGSSPAPPIVLGVVPGANAAHHSVPRTSTPAGFGCPGSGPLFEPRLAGRWAARTPFR